MNQPSCITKEREAQPRYLDAQAYSSRDAIVEKNGGNSRLGCLHIGADTYIGHITHKVQGDKVAQDSAETRQSALHSHLLFSPSVATGT